MEKMNKLQEDSDEYGWEEDFGSQPKTALKSGKRKNKPIQQNKKQKNNKNHY